MINDNLIQKYAHKYNYDSKEVEKKCNDAIDMLVNHKYFSTEDAIMFIETAIEGVINAN